MVLNKSLANLTTSLLTLAKTVLMDPVVSIATTKSIAAEGKVSSLTTLVGVSVDEEGREGGEATLVGVSLEEEGGRAGEASGEGSWTSNSGPFLVEVLLSSGSSFFSGD